MELNVLYEDNFIVAVNKPSGITTIPGNDQPREKSLVGMIEKYAGQKIFVVQRLDRETSGVVVFAKTPQAHKNLNLQFDRKEVRKSYIALVEGVCGFEDKEINIPVSKSKSRSRKPALSSKGLEAITRVRVLKRYDKYSLLEVVPVTGKRHQIRLHLKAIGHPLAFDRLYGRKDSLPLSEISGDPDDDGLLARMPLHAKRISFLHPETGAKISIEAGLLEDMALLC
jgi:RluA family pseudouridine synthase